MSDPARVMRAVNEVRAALAGWQEAATEAMSAAREEHQSLSATVQESGESAVRVRTRAANLAQGLAQLESSVADTRASLEAAAAAVERRVRTHQELTDHVTQTHAAWSGHVARAEDDHATAVRALNWARQVESDARHYFEAARAQVGGARSESEWTARQEELQRAEAEYNVAVTQRQRAEASVAEQGERVARYRQALGLAQQAAEVLQSTAAHVDSAVQAVETGQQRLSEVEAATKTAQAHLVRMVGYADEAVSHAGEADQHLTSATLHLDEAENWYQRGHLLAMDAGDEMADILQELQRIDAPMEDQSGQGDTRHEGQGDSQAEQGQSQAGESGKPGLEPGPEVPERIRDILFPSGQPIGTPQKGTPPEIRGVPTPQDLGDVFDQLKEGGSPHTPPTYPGDGYDLPDGGWVGQRESGKNGPTIDINVPGVPIRKIHVSGQ